MFEFLENRKLMSVSVSPVDASGLKIHTKRNFSKTHSFFPRLLKTSRLLPNPRSAPPILGRLSAIRDTVVTRVGTFSHEANSGVHSSSTVIHRRGVPMATLISTLFWDKKLKIAILTLATFAALC